MREPRGSLQPKSSCELERRLAYHPAKHAMEVKRRETSEACQRLQFERIVEVMGDVLDRGLDSSHVEGAGVGLHLSSL